MSDLADQLRHTAGHLINGTVEDGSVEVHLLASAADELEKLRRLLNARDDFIVKHGLWSEFTDGLPRS